jgi:hypothetical protein
MDACLGECMDSSMVSWMVCMDECIYAWMVACVDEWMHVCMGECMDA